MMLAAGHEWKVEDLPSERFALVWRLDEEKSPQAPEAMVAAAEIATAAAGVADPPPGEKE